MPLNCAAFFLFHITISYTFFLVVVSVCFVWWLFEQTCLLGRSAFGLKITLIIFSWCALDEYREMFRNSLWSQLSGTGEDGAGKMETAIKQQVNMRSYHHPAHTQSVLGIHQLLSPTYCSGATEILLLWSRYYNTELILEQVKSIWLDSFSIWGII